MTTDVDPSTELAGADAGSPVGTARHAADRPGARPGQGGPSREEAEGGWKDRSLGRRTTIVVGILVAVQIVAVIVFGSITIMRYSLWSAVDEGAHFDNIAYIA